MSYASRSRRRRGTSTDIWPGFVDVLSTLLLVMIFLLVVYMLAQYFLQRSVSEKSEALTELDHQVAELADLLSLERQSNRDMRSNISQLSAELQSSLAERDSLTLALSRAEDETDTLRLRLRDMTSEAQTALAEATEANQKTAEALLRAEESEAKVSVMLSDIEQLRRDIEALRTARSGLEQEVVQLAAALQSSKDEADQLTAELEVSEDQAKQLAAALLRSEDESKQLSATLEDSKSERAQLDAAFTVARDRSSELLAKLSDEVERTALAQKELEARDIRLRELQDLHLLSENQLVASRDLSRRQSDEIGLLNQQVLALRAQLSRIEAALDASESATAEQEVVIADLGRRLNLALAAKVEELAEYRSEFFGRLRQVLAGRKGFTIIGDRFVFQSEVLFGSGSAELGAAGKQSLGTFANVLQEVMTRIPEDLPWILQVDGHTDRIPIQTPRFPSNWELSAARAIEVVNYLVSEGIPPSRLSATGYGEFQPIDTRDDEIAYRRNRRIELKLTQR